MKLLHSGPPNGPGGDNLFGQNQKNESFKTTSNALIVISKNGGSSVRDGREGQTIH